MPKTVRLKGRAAVDIETVSEVTGMNYSEIATRAFYEFVGNLPEEHFAIISERWDNNGNVEDLNE